MRQEQLARNQLQPELQAGEHTQHPENGPKPAAGTWQALADCRLAVDHAWAALAVIQMTVPDSAGRAASSVHMANAEQECRLQAAPPEKRGWWTRMLDVVGGT
mmetsp:Transcript_82253/g.241492  ORF Transcript_82253/g.241492 Transcript_82253/m.241492 type:complete len:103 (-) Transcript_82253:1011-1319(-)